MSKRMTIRLDDDLTRELKERSKRDNTSLTETINRVLRNGLKAPVKKPKYHYVEKTYDMGVPRFDMTKANQMAAEMEDEQILRKMALGK
jgi:hypothetical protein